MSDNIQLTAELRTDVGKGASRRLRRLEDKVPGIIYGEGKDPQMLTLSANEVGKAMQFEAFYSQIIDLSVGGKKEQAVVRDMQRNPANERLLHIDFLRISANKAITVSVPLHFINEEACVGVKVGGGIISRTMTELDIMCLPKDLPEYLEVDMTDVEIGTTLHISDITLPKGVESVALSHGTDHDLPIAAVNKPKAKVEETDEPAAATDAAGESEEAASEE